MNVHTPIWFLIGNTFILPSGRMFFICCTSGGNLMKLIAFFLRPSIICLMLLKQEFQKSVVPLKYNDVIIGTGFLIGLETGEKDENYQKIHRFFLCTCKHVISSSSAPNQVTLNTRNSTANFTINRENWLQHTDNSVDLAILPIKSPSSVNPDTEYYFIKESDMKFDLLNSVYPGDGVFTMGFPMRLSGDKQNYPITRGGTIARIDPECLKEGSFLVDSFLFPGNSGGPIFNKPESLSVLGNPLEQSFLLGICAKYLSYKEPCVSEQTGDVIMTLIQHSGLSEIVPIKYAKDIYTANFTEKEFDNKTESEA